jgi:hypothetical protein
MSLTEDELEKAWRGDIQEQNEKDEYIDTGSDVHSRIRSMDMGVANEPNLNNWGIVSSYIGDIFSRDYVVRTYLR